MLISLTCLTLVLMFFFFVFCPWKAKLERPFIIEAKEYQIRPPLFKRPILSIRTQPVLNFASFLLTSFLKSAVSWEYKFLPSLTIFWPPHYPVNFHNLPVHFFIFPGVQVELYLISSQKIDMGTEQINSLQKLTTARP